jgi:photosystem II stability/assembly factor-like uncharacterized protein
LFLETLEDRTLMSATWTGVGPAPLVGLGAHDNGSTGTTSGRITGIAPDPTNTNIIYIATAGGGIWKTTDAQDAKPNWTPLTDNIPGTTDSMGAIAVAPSNTQVVYAGTGEANNSGDSNYGEGILFSNNGGSSWTLENPGGMFTGLTVGKIAIDPTNPNVAYAAVGNVGSNKAFIPGTGIYKTTNGGTTWTNTTASITNQDSFSDVAINPSNPSTVYAAVGPFYGSSNSGIYESTNGGTNWTLLSNFPNGSSIGRIALAIAPSNPSIIYAAAENASTGKLADLEESTDGGNTWTNLSNTPNFPNTQADYDLTLAVSPTNSSEVFAGGAAGPIFGEPAAIIVSTNSGANWTDLDLTKANAVTPHADHHALAFDANGNLLDGDDGGIFRLDNITPTVWSDLNGNLSTIQFENISIDPSTGNLIGGTQDNGTDLYNAATGAWTATDGGDGGQAVFASSTLVYRVSPVGSFGTKDFFRVSTNGGLTWTSATTGLNGNDPMNFYPPFSVDPTNPNRVLFGSNQIYQTTNAAGSWTALTATGSKGWNPSGNPVDSIGLGNDSKTIYAATGGSFATSSQIFVSTDGGTTWTERDLPNGSGRINQIIVDPTAAQTAYAVVSTFTTGAGHVFKTTDGGQSWTDISGNLPNQPTWSVQVDTVHNIIYVGNDEGVFSSADIGKTWTPAGTGLPNAQVFALDYNATANVLVAGTHGRGAWELPTAPPTVTLDPTSQIVKAGTSVQFTAAANSIPPATVQWQVSTNGGSTWSNIQGATLPTLTLNSVQPIQNGNEYRAVFTNGDGSSTTKDATLTVLFAPVVTTSPLNQTVNAGSPVSFRAAAFSNPSSFTVQWQVSTDGGNSFAPLSDGTDISGSTTEMLTLNNVSVSLNNTEYEAVFTNKIGSTTSGAATLTVLFAPILTTSPTNQTVTAGQNATFTAASNANPAATVQWEVSTGGGPFTPITGATSDTLTLNNVSFSLNGNEYEAVFTNGLGTVTTNPATLTVQTVPTVTTSPQSQTVSLGQTVTFTAAADGSPTPTVQWQLSTNGGATWNNISGATNTTLTLNSVQVAQNGSEYRAVFTNAAGTATTSAATLTVLFAPIVQANPSDVAVTVGQNASFTATAIANPAASVQWQVSLDDGNTWNDISGATSDTLTLTNVLFSQNDDEFRAEFTNSQGTTPTSAATLAVYIPPTVITNPSSQTLSPGQTATFTASASGNPTPTVQWQVSTDGGTTFGSIPGANSTTLTINNVQKYQDGYEYRAVFTNVVSSATTSAATLSIPYAPAVTINPTNLTVTAGQTATFNVAANGSPAPTVQWQLSTDGGNTWNNITGATSTTLTLNSSQASQNGNEYRAVFTNNLGTATTSGATLTVLSAPTVSVNPSNQTVFSGQKVTFTAEDDANPKPTVQWQVSTDGGNTFNNIAGAINPTLTLVGTTTAMSGNQYQAIFTNSQGTATTNPATLTVLTGVAPFIISNPISQTVTAGANPVSFTAFATGSPSPNVQWQVSTNGGQTFTNIPGATSPILTLNSATLSINGYVFQAVFTNPAGSAVSLPAKLTVTSSASSSQAPTVNVPPLLALINQLIGAIEKVNADGSVTFTYNFLGFPLIVANYDSSGNFVSASLLGISLPKSVWFM